MLQGHALILLIRGLLNKLGFSLLLIHSCVSTFCPPLSLSSYLKKISAIISSCLHPAAEKDCIQKGTVGKKMVPPARLTAGTQEVVKSWALLVRPLSLLPTHLGQVPQTV